MKTRILKPNLVFVFMAVNLLLFSSIFGQAPQKISYQAVVRNSSDQLVINQPVGMRVSILQGTDEGTLVYTEIYNPNPQTNANGLVALEIGTGIPLTGTFSAIDWSNGPYFLKTETDPIGGTNYTISGITQLLSVPYALYSETAESALTENDPLFSASPSSGISGTNISNWNTAHDWGNHAAAGYAPATHNHSAANITSGTLSIERIPTGTTATTVALGNHTHTQYLSSETDPTWSGTANQTAAIGRTGNVGIGTITPGALLHTIGTGTGQGNVLFVGSLKTVPGDPPATGPGTRMMWYPDKAAFRVGRVLLTQWDKDSIGINSVAMGSNTIAKGQNSMAFGSGTVASETSSLAFGTNAKASGANSTSIGGNTTASGWYSMALGANTTASGSFSMAMGYGALATGMHSFAIHLNQLTAPEVGANTFRVSGAASIGGNLAWTNHSDGRQKINLGQLSAESNLEKVLRLNAVRFRWKDYNNLLNLGFIAQEVEDIIPEAVRYDEVNDIYSMEYTAIIPVLVEAMKEQQMIIEKLQQTLEQQQQQIDALKNR